ncbi:MAG: dTDP-glucose pyrophosphorylase [Nitrospirota bacterium]
MKQTIIKQEVIGLIPAAGYSRRLNPIPCSKEIYPVGFSNIANQIRPKAVCLYLIDSMREAGIRKILVVIRKGKWDIPAYLGDGHQFGVEIVYRVMDESPGPPFALDHAYSFVRNATIAFGFPDIIVHAPQAFSKLLAELQDSDVDVVLGIFPIKRAIKDDRVLLGRRGQVREFVVSTRGSNHPHTWSIAVWGPRFTDYMHEFIERTKGHAGLRIAEELTVGHVIEPAFNSGIRMRGVMFPKGTSLDIGTPDSMKEAVLRYTSEVHTE